MSKQNLLITGAAGTIGQLLIQNLKDRYALLLCDQKEAKETAGFPFSTVDIANMASVSQVFANYTDIHTVIHLAADPRISAPWESLLPNNIVGTYNVFEAAHQAGVKRVIYASSINSVDGYRTDIQVNTNMPVAPANLYGASKAWGEAVGRFYADYKNMAVHCLRIGWVTKADNPFFEKAPNKLLHMTLTHSDLLHFFDTCLASEHNFGIWHVISDNHFKRLDISDTQEKLGYAPEDDGFVLAGKWEKSKV